MIINRHINTSEDALFKFFNDMILQDIQQTSINEEHKQLELKDCREGFEYKKSIRNKTGKDGLVNTRIEQLDKGVYEVSFTSSNGINYVKYSYEAIDENTVDLEYEERFESDLKGKSLNHSVMSWFYKKSSKKRINELLNRIEYLVNQQPV